MTDERHIEFATVGGTQPIAVFEPSAGRPVVVVLPALGIEARYYSRFARGLQEHGMGAALVDHPGLGASPVRADADTDWDYFDLYTHVCEAGRAIATDFPDHPLILLGHSLGGHLALIARPGPPILGVRLERDAWVPEPSMRGLLDKVSSRAVTFETWPN